ncbi:MAG: hypothetical protein Q7S83_00225 [bacterium]|nr:hypothetical protein [bacterium]
MLDESYLCIDIGTSSIKVLEKNAFGKVLSWGILERPSKSFHSSIRPIDAEDAAGALTNLLSCMGVSTQSAVMSLPSFYVFTVIADVVDPKFIPANPATYRLEATQLDDGRYFIVAIPKEVSEKYEAIADLCALRLVRLELESSAIAHRFQNDLGRKLVVDIGSRSTTFSVVRNGSVEYVFHSDFGGASQALDGVPYIKSYVWDVIMNKTREIAEKQKIEQALFSNSVFNIANGLQKISSQAFNGHS